MSPSAPSYRSITLGLLAAALLLGRLALDLHPYEHPLDAGDETVPCEVCMGGAPPGLQAGVHVLPAATVPAAGRASGRPGISVPPRLWTRPPYRGPPSLV